MAVTGLAFGLVACGCTAAGFTTVAGFSPRGLIDGFGASDADLYTLAGNGSFVRAAGFGYCTDFGSSCLTACPFFMTYDYYFGYAAAGFLLGGADCARAFCV